MAAVDYDDKRRRFAEINDRVAKNNQEQRERTAQANNLSSDDSSLLNNIAAKLKAGFAELANKQSSMIPIPLPVNIVGSATRAFKDNSPLVPTLPKTIGIDPTSNHVVADITRPINVIPIDASQEATQKLVLQALEQVAQNTADDVHLIPEPPNTIAKSIVQDVIKAIPTPTTPTVDLAKKDLDKLTSSITGLEAPKVIGLDKGKTSLSIPTALPINDNVATEETQKNVLSTLVRIANNTTDALGVESVLAVQNDVATEDTQQKMLDTNVGIRSDFKNMMVSTQNAYKETIKNIDDAFQVDSSLDSIVASQEGFLTKATKFVLKPIDAIVPFMQKATDRLSKITSPLAALAGKQTAYLKNINEGINDSKMGLAHSAQAMEKHTKSMWEMYSAIYDREMIPDDISVAKEQRTREDALRGNDPFGLQGFKVEMGNIRERLENSFKGFDKILPDDSTLKKVMDTTAKIAGFYAGLGAVVGSSSINLLTKILGGSVIGSGSSLLSGLATLGRVMLGLSKFSIVATVILSPLYALFKNPEQLLGYFEAFSELFTKNIAPTLEWIATEIVPALGVTFAGLMVAAETLMDYLGTAINKTLIYTIGTLLPEIFTTLGKTIDALWQGIKGAVLHIAGIFGIGPNGELSIFENLTGAFGDLFGGINKAIDRLAFGISDFIINRIVELGTVLNDGIKNLFGVDIAETLSKGFSTVSGFVQDTFKTWFANITDMGNRVMGMFGFGPYAEESFIDNFLGLFKKIFTNITTLFDTLYTGIIKGLGLSSFFGLEGDETIIGRITRLFTEDIPKWFYEKIDAMKAWFTAENILEFFQNNPVLALMDTMRSFFFEELPRWWFNKIDELGQWLFGFSINDLIGGNPIDVLKDKIKAFFNSILNLIPSWDDIKGWIGDSVPSWAKGWFESKKEEPDSLKNPAQVVPSQKDSVKLMDADIGSKQAPVVVMAPTTNNTNNVNNISGGARRGAHGNIRTQPDVAPLDRELYRSWNGGW